MMVTIQVTAVQSFAGRGSDPVRVFGYRVGDLLRRVVQVTVSSRDACDIVESAADRRFPVIEVPDHAWVHCINSGEVETLSFNNTTEGA